MKQDMNPESRVLIIGEEKSIHVVPEGLLCAWQCAGCLPDICYFPQSSATRGGCNTVLFL